MLRKEKEEAETRECTFKPAISKRSDRLMSERADTLKSLNLSAHQQLYQDSLRRQQKCAVQAGSAVGGAAECAGSPTCESTALELPRGAKERRGLASWAHKADAPPPAPACALLPPPRQEEYANWYPEDVTFHPRLVAKSPRGGRPAPYEAEGPKRVDPAALVDRLYASYEKVGGGEGGEWLGGWDAAREVLLIGPGGT
jgi:hypothetical protein